MRVLLTILFLLAIPVAAFAQPLNGSYTIGGASPDFSTPQEAADALKRNGVSGLVFMNIRPGIYIRDGGLSSVMVVDSIVAGIAPERRITFQPDEAAGGSVENVVFQIDQVAQTTVAAVRIQVDYVTIRNLTLEDIDSAEAGANSLVAVSRYFSTNLSVEGTIIEGCRFIGNPSPVGGTTFGTDYGVYAEIAAADIIVRSNSFARFLRAIDLGTSGSGSGTIHALVEDNVVLASHFGATGSGSFLGHGVFVQARNAIVRRNHLDNAGGRGSIRGIIVQADTGLVERNTILNGGSVGPGSAQNGAYTGIMVDGRTSGTGKSMRVVNNLITGATSSGVRIGIDVRTTTEILHNTIVHPQRTQRSKGIAMELGLPDSCTVLNNILIDHGTRVPGQVAPLILFDQSDGMSGLVSDYNVFYLDDPAGFLVQRVGVRFTDLSSYQAGTGLDTHTIVKSIDFVNGGLGIRLSPCQAQDSELAGIPLASVGNDIDGDVRSTTFPFRGADEGHLREAPMFGDVLTLPLTGTPFSVAAGQLDGVPGDELVVPDYDNKQIRIYHANSGERSFSPLPSLSTLFPPVAIQLYDLNEDGHLDVIVGGDTAALSVFWGDGLGGFPEETRTETLGRVVSIEPFGARSIAVTEAIGLVPNSSFLGVIEFKTEPLFPGVKFLCHSVLSRDEGLFSVNDTLPTVMHDFAVGDHDGDGASDAVAIGLGSGGTQLVSFDSFVLRIEIGGGVCGTSYRAAHAVSPFNIGPFAGHTSNIISRDFDGDSDPDLVITGETSSLLSFLRNQGDLTFAEELLPTLSSQAVAALDYENDGDLDIAAVNRSLDDNGITMFLNDGAGHFAQELNCHQNFGFGIPFGAVSRDFDLDGRADLAIASSFDSIYVLYNFGGGITDIASDPIGGVPGEFVLHQNYPNPFNPLTTIDFDVTRAGHVTLIVYDVLGRRVAGLVDEPLEAGLHSVVWDAERVSTGTYYYQLRAGSDTQTRRMIVVR